MVTDQDRELAREQACLRYHNHVTNDPAGCDANHIAKNIGYEETTRRGLLAECAWRNEFGGELDKTLNSSGDGGRDFWLRLYLAPRVRRFKVNLKSKSVRSNFDGMVKVGTHLRVPVSECHPLTIYVFAIYLEQTDDAEILRWEWGRTLIQQNQRAIFEGGNDKECYIKLFQELRDLQELKDRMKPHGFVGYDEEDHFLHYCHCGREAGFGSGVSLLHGRLGTWTCREHWSGLGTTVVPWKS